MRKRLHTVLILARFSSIRKFAFLGSQLSVKNALFLSRPIKKKRLRQSISETLRNVLKDNLHGTDIASTRNINTLVLVSQGYCSQEVFNPSPH